jgi:hypothetical protein
VAFTDVKQIGPEYDAGLDSPTYGKLGLFIKPQTFFKELQTQLRDEVIGALNIAVGDRDLNFWKRQSQGDWSQGDGQVYFSNPARYDSATSLDVHTPGQVRLVPQPTRSLAATATLNGRGACTCKQKAFFPWVDGKYCWADATTGGVVSQANTPAVAVIADIVSDGTTVFFALATGAGVWQTPGNVPVGLTQYDNPGSFYGRLAYDQLRKILYATSGAQTGLAKLEKINAGGASTIIYDFLAGRLDALEMHLGNVILGWNDGGNVPVGAAGSMGQARLFKYDGTNMTTFVDFPNGTMVVGLKSSNGTLYVMVDEQDPLDKSNAPATVHAVYAVSGSTITRLSNVDGNSVGGGTGSVYPIGSPTEAEAIGQHVFFPGTGHVTRYDTALGGFSRSLGDDGLPAAAGFIAATMSSLAFLSGVGLLCEYGGGVATGGIYNLHGTIFGIVPSSAAVGTCKLTGSRMDAGLPYVGKFWYAWEAIFSALLAGESVEMEYSIDDGTTWVACGGSPANTVGQTQKAFLIQQQNPHARYRVKLLPNGGVTAGPKLYSVSGRYAVLNPNASVYRMTISALDTIRGRGNQLDLPGYGKDALDYLDNIARKNELVTFYEPDDSTRTPHTCWVMQYVSPRASTSSVYDPKKKEGEGELVLWEVV